MSAGIKGVSAAQDARYLNKEKKLLKSMKFPKEYTELKVDLSRVNWEVMKVWIAQRVTELLGIEDDVLIGYIYEQLEGHKTVDPRQLQIALTGFLEKNTSLFCKELWVMLASASANDSGIPQAILDAKAAEVAKRKEVQDAITARLKEEEAKREAEREKERQEEKKARDTERAHREKERLHRDRDRDRDSGRDRDRDRDRRRSPDARRSGGRDDRDRRLDRRRPASRSPDTERERRRRRERRSRTRSPSPALPPAPLTDRQREPAADEAVLPPPPERKPAQDLSRTSGGSGVAIEDDRDRKQREKREKKEKKEKKKEAKRLKKEKKEQRHKDSSNGKAAESRSDASDSDAEGKDASSPAAKADALEKELREQALRNVAEVL